LEEAKERGAGGATAEQEGGPTGNQDSVVVGAGSAAAPCARQGRGGRLIGGVERYSVGQRRSNDI
jgi:hypothetical protein